MLYARAFAVLAAPLLCAGCANDDGSLLSGAPYLPASAHVHGPASNTTVATWQMPWQISPISAAAGRERIVEGAVPEVGTVRGTPEALASIGTTLRPVAGSNQAVLPCRKKVSGEAAKLGATEIEAASAGPERRIAAGVIAAPVVFRITYSQAGRRDVRLSVLTCIVDRRGHLVDAYAGARGAI